MNKKLTIKEISKTISKSKTVIRMHLRNLEREGIIRACPTSYHSLASLSGTSLHPC
jgi:DNA-binding GntR family transcriptional regulator